MTFIVKNCVGEVGKFNNPAEAIRFYCNQRHCFTCPMHFGPGSEIRFCLVSNPDIENLKLANEQDPDGFQIKLEDTSAKTQQEPEQRTGGQCTDIIKLSSKAYQLIGCIEGLSYFLMKPEAQNLAQDNLCELTKIVDKLVDYAKGEAT